MHQVPFIHRLALFIIVWIAGVIVIVSSPFGWAQTTTTTSTPSDTTPPVISNVTTALTPTGAIVTWTTNEPTDTRLQYGVGLGYEMGTRSDSALTTSHSMAIEWPPNSYFRFRVLAIDAAGNPTFGNDTQVNTAPAADTIPPVISGVSSNYQGETSATVVWTTDESSDSETEYGKTTSYGSTTGVQQTGGVTSHNSDIVGIYSGTLYHYRVKSRDAAGNLTVSPDYTFTTKGSALPATVTSPSAGASWPIGSTQTISWSGTGNVDVHTILFNASTGALVKYIYVTGSHQWFVGSDVAPGQYIIGVEWCGPCSIAYADSVGKIARSGVFTVAPPAPDSTPPVISNVKPYITDQSSFWISWNTNKMTDGQLEYGLTTAYGSESYLGNTAGATFHQFGAMNLSPGTLYHYRVKSRDAAGNLTISSDYTITTTVSSSSLPPPSTPPPSTTTTTPPPPPSPTGIPSAPSGLTARRITSGTYEKMRYSITLKWTDNSPSQTRYFERYTMAGVAPWSWVAGTEYSAYVTSTEAYVGNTLGTHYYRVRACNSFGCSDYSNVASFDNVYNSKTCMPESGIPDTTPPSVPTGLTAMPIRYFEINVGWKDSTDNVSVKGYHLYRNGMLVPVSQRTDQTEDARYTGLHDNYLSAGNTYTYAVEAFDQCGNVSARSASVSAATPDNDTLSQTDCLAKGREWCASSTVTVSWCAPYGSSCSGASVVVPTPSPSQVLPPPALPPVPVPIPALPFSLPTTATVTPLTVPGVYTPPPTTSPSLEHPLAVFSSDEAKFLTDRRSVLQDLRAIERLVKRDVIEVDAKQLKILKDKLLSLKPEEEGDASMLKSYRQQITDLQNFVPENSERKLIAVDPRVEAQALQQMKKDSRLFERYIAALNTKIIQIEKSGVVVDATIKETIVTAKNMAQRVNKAKTYSNIRDIAEQMPDVGQALNDDLPRLEELLRLPTIMRLVDGRVADGEKAIKQTMTLAKRLKLDMSDELGEMQVLLDGAKSMIVAVKSTGITDGLSDVLEMQVFVRVDDVLERAEHIRAVASARQTVNRATTDVKRYEKYIRRLKATDKNKEVANVLLGQFKEQFTLLKAMSAQPLTLDTSERIINYLSVMTDIKTELEEILRLSSPDPVRKRIERLFSTSGEKIKPFAVERLEQGVL